MIKRIANYSNRHGLPGYSSHQFSLCLRIELVTTDDVTAESESLYQLLQSNVDEQRAFISSSPARPTPP